MSNLKSLTVAYMKVLINENNQIKKQTNENKVEFEYGNSDNSNIKNPL